MALADQDQANEVCAGALARVLGECYICNVAGLEFWRAIPERHGGSHVVLPRRKRWDGRLWDSWHLTIPNEERNARVIRRAR